MKLPQVLAVVLGSVVLNGVLGGVASVPAHAVVPLPVATDVDYQLGGAVDPAANVGIVVRDRLEAPVPGRYNICYVNAFQAQPDARDFWSRRPGLVLHRAGQPVVDEAWDEWLLDPTRASSRRGLTKIMGRWMAGCAAAGFQAVELDNLDSWTRSGALIVRAQALAYARLLVGAAHARGLAVGQKNVAGLDGTRLGFDFAIAEECGRYRECGRYVSHYGNQVLAVEYRARDFAATCAAYGASLAVVLRDRALSPTGVRRWC